MTTITKPDGPDGSGGGAAKAFSFDHSYWSFDKNDPNYAGQQRLYEDLGVELLNHSFNGYNTCIVACKSNGPSKLCIATLEKMTIPHLVLRRLTLVLHMMLRNRRTDRKWKVVFNGE